MAKDDAFRRAVAGCRVLRLERLDGDISERDCWSACAALRHGDLVANELLPDVQPPLEELDVLPAESQQLAAAQAGGQCNGGHMPCGRPPGLLSVLGRCLQR